MSSHRREFAYFICQLAKLSYRITSRTKLQNFAALCWRANNYSKCALLRWRGLVIDLEVASSSNKGGNPT